DSRRAARDHAARVDRAGPPRPTRPRRVHAMRGDGRLDREPGSRFWWMAYYVHGRYVRQSTEETDEQKARRVLRKHIAAVLHGDVVANERRVTLGDLL